MRELLINKRKKKKITQHQMAERIGVSRSTYSAYELGTIDPPLKVIMKIKEVLDYKNDNIFLNQNVSITDRKEEN